MFKVSISEFGKDVKKYFDKVEKGNIPLIINRGKDPAVVLISLKEYNSHSATMHEMSSKANETRLDSAIEKMKKSSTQ